MEDEDFKAFCERRKKADPTSRGLSRRQWKQAYEAHLAAKDRVGANVKRGSDSGQSGKLSLLSDEDAKLAKRRIREVSAYRGIRLSINTLAILLLLSVGPSLFSLFSEGIRYDASFIYAVLVHFLILWAILVLRALATLIVDTADASLQSARRG